MLNIDLFNKAADEKKIAAAITDNTFRFRSKMYAKYVAKSVAQDVIVIGTITLAIIGTLAVISEAMTTNEDAE